MLAVDPDMPVGSNPTQGAGWALWVLAPIALVTLVVLCGPWLLVWVDRAARRWVAWRDRTALDRMARSQRKGGSS